jgi:quercetin dioxygenase-like cupin family protein
MFVVDLDALSIESRGGGLSSAFPIHSAAGAASSATVVFEIEPGGELPRHVDSAEELLLVLQGVAEASIGDETGRLETHQVAVVPAMAPHGLRNVGDETLRVFGTFSASTVIATFEEPMGPDRLQVFAIGGPTLIAVPLEEPVAA